MGWVVIPLLLFVAQQVNFYDQGMKALDEKRYQAAVEDFTSAITAEPNDFTAHFNLALALSLLNRDTEAISEYQRTLQLKPDLYQADLNLGILLLRQKRGAEAVPYLTSAAGQKPNEFRPNYYLGEALLADGQAQQAEPHYKAALVADPKSAAAELGFAHALVSGKRLDEAKPHFQKAAELDARYRNDLLELASLYEANKQSAEAISLYQQFPDDPGAQERVGELLVAAGKASDAIAHLQAAVEKSPTTANRAALAEAYLSNKEPEKALRLVPPIVAAEPNNYDVRMLSGRVFRDSRKYSQAADEYYQATKMKPDTAQAWTELADMLVLLENYPAALTALDRVAALHAEKPGHVYVRAIVLDKMKQLKPALESYKRFLAMSTGLSPDEEFKARQRARIIERELSK
jgi:tetratricopeptide (TPR) repeat protein